MLRLSRERDELRVVADQRGRSRSAGYPDRTQGSFGSGPTPRQLRA